MFQIKNTNFTVKYLRIITAFLCICGVILSLYAYHVEKSKEKDKSYIALCDISEYMSCTAVFSSRYGKGFGLLEKAVEQSSILNQPNSVYGIIFYAAFFPLGEVQSTKISKILIFFAILSNLCSVYLASILIFILHDLCIVCVTTYVINFFLLICSVFRYRLHKMKMKDALKKFS